MSGRPILDRALSVAEAHYRDGAKPELLIDADEVRELKAELRRSGGGIADTGAPDRSDPSLVGTISDVRIRVSELRQAPARVFAHPVPVEVTGPSVTATPAPLAWHCHVELEAYATGWRSRDASYQLCACGIGWFMGNVDTARELHRERLHTRAP